jgi:hypothetical protein
LVLNKNPLRLLAVTVTLVTLAVIGYWLLFTQFMVYDDEGYVLWSLHNYFESGGLYSTVYSQYGPFLFTLYDGLHGLFGLVFNNETGRLITLLYWVGAAGLAGLFTWRQTRSGLAACGAMILTFGSLLVMINEPIHPGGLLAFLSAIGAVGGALLLEGGRTRVFAVLGGIIGAAMVLTKINVGAFFLIATGSWLAINSPRPTLSRASIWLCAIGSLLLPFWLMQRLWPTPWVAIFALSFSCAALSMMPLLQQQRRSQFGWLPWMYFAGTTAVVVVVVLGLTWWRGTSLAMLWHGVVVAPMQQPVAYAHPVNWPAVVPWLALAMAGGALWLQLRNWGWRPHLLAGLRLVVGGLFLIITLRSIDNSLTFFSFQYGLVFAWLMAVPLHANAHSPTLQARVWLAWVMVWQTLHAYPVAGSQMGWGAFLWVPLAVVGVYEGLQFWAEKAGSYRRTVQWAGILALVAGSAATVWSLGYVSYRRYFISQPIGLTGASDLRLSDDMTAMYRILNKNIRQHGDMLFSYPGMFSLNIWTELPTPTLANVTHWFSLLSESQQQAIIDQLAADKRPVLVVQSYLINYLVFKGYPPRSNLQRYLLDNFAPVFRLNTFEFWVRKDRTIAPLSVAGFVQKDVSAPAKLELTTDATGEMASIEIRGLYYPYNRVAGLTLSAATPVNITTLDAANQPAGSISQATSPTSLTGINRIEFTLPPNKTLPKLDILEVVILNAKGEPLDALLFNH